MLLYLQNLEAPFFDSGTSLFQNLPAQAFFVPFSRRTDLLFQ